MRSAGGEPTAVSAVDSSSELSRPDPRSDLYGYANASWLRANTAPDQPKGRLAALYDEVSQQRREIIVEAAAQKNPASNAARDVGVYYRSLINTGEIDDRGNAPVKAALAAIGPFETTNDILTARFSPSLWRHAPIAIDVEVVARLPGPRRVTIAQRTPGLISRAAYVEQGFEAERKAYAAYLTALLEWAVAADLIEPDPNRAPADRSAAVLSIYQQIAEQQWSVQERANPALNFHPLSASDLEATLPGVPWAPILNGLGLTAPGELVVRERSAIAATAQILADAPVAVLKDELILALISHYADALPLPARDATASFRAALGRPPLDKEEWARAQLRADLPEALGKLYVEAAIADDAMTAAQSLAETIRAAAIGQVATLEWLAPETRVTAQEKLRRVRFEIGAPAQFRDYGIAGLKADDALGNRLRLAKAEADFMAASLAYPALPDPWQRPAFLVAAAYIPARNTLAVPAALLQPPFFEMNREDAENYGALGVLIGHELAHAIDLIGAQVDARGEPALWWSREDQTRFAQAAAPLIADLEAFAAEEGIVLHGPTVESEILGDLFGLTVAAKAAPGGPSPLFFEAWAKIWARQGLDEPLPTQRLTAPHAPALVRTNGLLRHIDGFHEAFATRPQDLLFLPPNARRNPWDMPAAPDQ